MRKKNIILILFMLLLAFSVAADYTRVGTGDLDYQVDASVVGEAGTVLTPTGAKGIFDSATTPPNVKDINGDGIREIILLNNLNLAFYQNATLTAINATAHGLTAPYSNVELFDIDGDGVTEVILAGANKEIKIYSLNGTRVILENTLSFVWVAYSQGSLAIRCRGVNECLLVAQDEDTRAATDFRAFVFSSTNGTQTNFNLQASPSTDNFNCFPKINQITLANLDNEGDLEYIIPSVYVDITGSDVLKVYAAFVNNSDPTDAYLLTSYNIRSNGFSNEQTCELGLYENYIGAAVAGEFYDSNSADEIAIPYRYDVSNVKLIFLQYDGTVFDLLVTFPTIIGGAWPGYSISNPMVMDFCPLNDVTDVCFLANTDGATYNLYCSCIDSFDLIGGVSIDATYNFILTSVFNLTDDYKSYTGLIHNGLTGNSANADLITTWGVYNLSRASGNDDLTTSRLKTWGKNNGSVIISSAQDANGDVLVRTKTNLWYIDDNFINSPGQITEVSFNPCITDDITKVNTTIAATVTVGDVDGNDVNFWGSLYYGESYNNTQGWTTTNQSHGASHTFPFQATNIRNNAILKVCGRDTANPGLEDCQSFGFNVGLEGVSYGDTTCAVEFVLVDPIIPGVTPPSLSDVPASIIPVDAVPVIYYPLVSLLIIALISGGTVFILAQNNITGAGVLAAAGGGAGLLSWLGLIMVGMVAAWTLIVGVLFAAAGVGVFVFIGSNR